MIDLERSMPAPASLAQGSSWNEADVLDRLHDDFLGKCYLCESKIEPAEFEVEHRVPRATDETLVYAWANLFPACDFCNGRRPA